MGRVLGRVLGWLVLLLLLMLLMLEMLHMGRMRWSHKLMRAIGVNGHGPVEPLIHLLGNKLLLVLVLRVLHVLRVERNGVDM